MMEDAGRFERDLEDQVNQRRYPEQRHEIPHQPPQDGKMPAPQRILPLQQEQEREERAEDRTAHVVEQRDWFHHDSAQREPARLAPQSESHLVIADSVGENGGGEKPSRLENRGAVRRGLRVLRATV